MDWHLDMKLNCVNMSVLMAGLGRPLMENLQLAGRERSLETRHLL